MATTIIKTTFQLKRGSSGKWEELDLVLAAGEPGFEIDTNKLKIGDGQTSWNNLPYISNGGNVTVDMALSETSLNPIANKAVAEAIKRIENHQFGEEFVISDIDGIQTIGLDLETIKELLNFDQLVTEEELNQELDNKIDEGSISHSTEFIAEGVAVEGTKMRIVVDAYTKAETLSKIHEKITEVGSGESAGEVLSQLNSYIEINNARVGQAETAIFTQNQALTNTNASITELRNGAVATNSREINSIKERLITVEETEVSHKDKIEAIEDEIIALQSDLNTTSNLINNNSTAIFNLDANVKNQINRIDSIEDTIGIVDEDKTLIQIINENKETAEEYTNTKTQAAQEAAETAAKNYTSEEVNKLALALSVLEDKAIIGTINEGKLTTSLKDQVIEVIFDCGGVQ